ncbi:MAG: ATP-binding protein [Cyclobacteriaceae bacterium]
MQTTDLSFLILPVILTSIILVGLMILILYSSYRNLQRRFVYQQELQATREAFGKELMQSKIEIQEQSLDAIGKELHSNISHLASLININLGELKQYKLPEKAVLNVADTKEFTRELLVELRSLNVRLNSDHIMKIGFQKALNRELERLDKVGLNTSLIKKGQEFSLNSDREIILYRLCQEVFNNIIKHAQASMVKVTLDYTEMVLNLSIEDDGVGFDLESIEKHNSDKGSTGLSNIRQRSESIEGKAIFQSKSKSGTLVTIVIPKKFNLSDPFSKNL